MKQCIRIDEQGLFIEDVLLMDDVPLTEDLIETLCPSGFYLPKWDGMQWVEGATQEYIDSLVNAFPTQTTEERLQELVNNIADMQTVVMLLSIE